jgi:hypothetical protein
MVGTTTAMNNNTNHDLSILYISLERSEVLTNRTCMIGIGRRPVHAAV